MSADLSLQNSRSTPSLDKEREFHNARFENGDGRDAQLKYYWAIEAGGDRYHARVAELASAADVLDYGCSVGASAARIKDRCRSLVGIDISDVAIEVARREVATGEVAKFFVMDAMDMSFPDDSFDLAFGSGILHHLDTEGALCELRRVLRPGGRVVLWEPLGLNPAINFYRYITPAARTEDEHPLLPADFAIMRRTFSNVRVEFYGFTTIAAVPFRHTALGTISRLVLQRFDSIVARIPYVQLLCWYSLIECEK
jgi:SAM-dependent methyltransferase